MKIDKPIYNQLYFSADYKRYVTFERTSSRKRPYALRLALEVSTSAGGFYGHRQIKQQWLAFLPCPWADYSELTLDQALQIMIDWKLSPVAIFNGHPEAYAAIKAEAERLHMPEHYQNDLYVIDRQILCCPTAPDSFIWVLRSHGTHLFRLDTKALNNPKNYNPAELIGCIKTNFDAFGHFIYIYQDGQLKQITWDYAKTLATEAQRSALEVTA